MSQLNDTSKNINTTLRCCYTLPWGMSQLIDTSKNTNATLKSETLAWCVSHLFDSSKNASATLKCCYALHMHVGTIFSHHKLLRNKQHPQMEINLPKMARGCPRGWVVKNKKIKGGGGGTHAVLSPCEMQLSTRCTVQLHTYRVTFRSGQLGNATTTYQDARSYWGSQAMGLLKPITKQDVNENQDTTRLNTPNNGR